MQIDVALVPQQADDWQHFVCIVVDVIRASTTLVTLFEQGMELARFIPAVIAAYGGNAD